MKKNVVYTQNIVPIKSIPGDLFAWVDGVGVTEESTLSANGHDDFTYSFVIRSNRTGNYMTFYLQDEMFDENGEILYWVYKSKTDVEVTILND